MNPFLFIKPSDFVISEPRAMSASDQSLDVRVSDLAGSTAALRLLCLVSMYATEANSLEFFAFYLACFNMDEMEARKAHLLQDPVVRVWVADPAKLGRLREALGNKVAA